MGMKKKFRGLWVRERTKPTERQPLVGEVSADFCGYRVPHGQRGDGGMNLTVSMFPRRAASLLRCLVSDATM
jgi:hypothetical protein